MSKTNKDSLGDRMKCYEAVPKVFLTRRTPVIMRLDGKTFHSFTKGFDKPFDFVMVNCMQRTMLELCKEIQGCVLGYTQSDEITLVLQDYLKLDTDAWFGYNVQKMVSVATSYATLAFDRSIRANLEWLKKDNTDGKWSNKIKLIERKLDKGAYFDCRVFNVPKEEVNNCLVWRQQDAERNSVNSLAQQYFSHKELQGVKVKALQDKLFTEKGINWNDLPTSEKRGSCAIKDEEGKWFIDKEIPIFTQDTEYVNNRIIF